MAEFRLHLVPKRLAVALKSKGGRVKTVAKNNSSRLKVKRLAARLQASTEASAHQKYGRTARLTAC